MYDIGIIGGGTAGMTAAIYGQRAGKRTVIIEGGTFGGQITSSPNVENYPGIASVSGSEFSMNLLDQAMKLGAETQMAQVTGIRDEGEVKVIVTPEKEYPCKSIILATGVTHRHLGAPNEERLTGAGVSYCATCDGMFFRGKEVAVVGGGNTAFPWSWPAGERSWKAPGRWRPLPPWRGCIRWCCGSMTRRSPCRGCRCPWRLPRRSPPGSPGSRCC